MAYQRATCPFRSRFPQYRVDQTWCPLPVLTLAIVVLCLAIVPQFQDISTAAEPAVVAPTTKEPSAKSQLEVDTEADARLREVFEGKSAEHLQMIPIRGGTYTMGNSDNSTLNDFFPVDVVAAFLMTERHLIDQEPEHVVEVDGFYIGKYEVTVEHVVFFLNSVQSNDDRFLHLNTFSPVRFDGRRWSFEPGSGRQAANTVTWFGADEFCKWLSEHTGDRYRLPREAEWEFAARGVEGRLFPWGGIKKDFNAVFKEIEQWWLDQPGDPNRELGDAELELLSQEFHRRQYTWDGSEKDLFEEAVNLADWGQQAFVDPLWKRQPVGSYPEGATPEGVCDMVGGVWEWCSDWYRIGYSGGKQVNPRGPSMRVLERLATGDASKVLRGGMSNAPPGSLTLTTSRLDKSRSGSRSDGIYGFRLVREPDLRDGASEMPKSASGKLGANGRKGNRSHPG